MHKHMNKTYLKKAAQSEETLLSLSSPLRLLNIRMF